MQPLLPLDLFSGQLALVTGGTSGIGLAIAQALARHGATVGVMGRNAEKAEAAARSIEDEGGRARALPGDVRDAAAVERILGELVAAEGPLDILVNGAAGNFPAPAVAISPNGFKSVVEIDLLGTFHLCRAAFPHLRQPGARVLNISAGQAFMPSIFQAHVCAAKAGVDMLTRVLAMEWGPAGIRVNSLSPGPVDDTEGMKRLAATPELREAALRSVPLCRFASASEIADIAVVLCSPLAAYVHGAVIVADGGHTLGGFGGLGNAMLGG